MPDRMSDSEILEQTAEWLSRLAETIERVTERMADKIARLSAEQEKQADDLRALSNRIEGVMRATSDPGLCIHGISFAPGRAMDGRSQWCGECFPVTGPAPRVQVP